MAQHTPPCRAWQVLAIFDKDTFSADDPMGEVHIPLHKLATGQLFQGKALVTCTFHM